MARWILDVTVLHQVVDGQREQRGMSWRQLGRDLQVAPVVFRRMRAGRAPDSHTLGTVLMWLGWAPELALLVRERQAADKQAGAS